REAVPSRRARSCPASVNRKFLGAAHAGIVGREEQNHACEVNRHDPAFQTLRALDTRLALRIEPELELAFGHYPAWQDRLDTNIRLPELTRHAARKTVNGGLRADIDGQLAGSDLPTDRTEIDDRAAAQLLHHRRNRLDGKKERPQVDGHAVVPVVRLDF